MRVDARIDLKIKLLKIFESEIVSKWILDELSLQYAIYYYNE